MVGVLRKPTTRISPWSSAITFLSLGVALLAYYVSPQLWLALPFGLLFVALAVLRLDLALIFVIFSAPFYLFPKNFGEMAFSLTEFTTVACFVALVLRNLQLLRNLNVSKLRSFTPILRNPVVLFALAATISLTVSEYPKYSLREYRTTIIEPLLFFTALISIPIDRKGVWRFIDAFVLLGAAVAAFSIYHYFFVGVVEATGGVRRVLAIYHSPNALALFLGRTASLSILLTFLSGKVDGRRHARPFYAVASLLMVFTLFLTYSRGAWVAVAVSLASMLILWAFTKGRSMLRKTVWLIIGGTILAVFALGIGSLLLPVLNFNRLLSQASDLERIYLWQAAIAMIRDHPVFGVGLDNFLYQYPKYMLPEAWAEPNVSHPHNIILDYWLRLGLPGLLALFALMYSFWRSGLLLCRKVVDTEKVVIAVALMGIMTDFIVHGLIDNSFFLIDLAVVFWLTYGLMKIAERETS